MPGNQFREAKSWLSERAPLLRDEGEDEFDWSSWGARAVYTEDPARNVIELISFTASQTFPERSFGADSILGVAELGLPVADVHGAVAELRNTFGIGLWDRDEIIPERITPVGEPGATFIVVPVGRTWFLGDVASDHPLAVTLEGVGEGSLDFPGHPYSIRGVG